MSLITGGFGNTDNSAIYKFDINIQKHLFKIDNNKIKFNKEINTIYFKIKKVDI